MTFVQVDRLREAEATVTQLQARITRMREVLEDARVHIHNEFDVETHVETYHRVMRDIDAVLKET